jgi:hypothetical protein
MRVSCGVCGLVVSLFASACAEAGDGTAFTPIEPARAAFDVPIRERDAGLTESRTDGPTTEESVDGGSDAESERRDGAREAAAVRDSACSAGVLAIVAGGTSSAGAITWADGAWSSVTSLASTMMVRPHLVATSTGFGIASVASDNSLQYAAFASGNWSPLAPVAVGLRTWDEPRIVVNSIATDPRLVFQMKGGAGDSRYFFSSASMGAWSAPEGIGAGNDVSFGPRAAAATTTTNGANMVIAHAGGNGLLYARERAATAWTASVQIGSITVRNDLPVAATELFGGMLLSIFSIDTGTTQKLAYATRSGKSWTVGGAVFDNGINRAFSNDPTALLPLASGRALLVFRGGDTNLYATTFDPTGAVKWSAPSTVTSSGIATMSAPSLAAGICGADAIAAFVETGTVKLVRLTAGVWSVPEKVPGLAGATYVGIASKP